MNEITVFNNDEFGSIRTVTIENEPWLVGKDVAEVLGYTNPSKALADHVDTEDKLNNETLLSLGQRGGWLINESGLYSLILSSKLPSAKKFKRWVTSEVLPAIRKTGSYNLPDFNNPAEAARAWAKEYEEKQKALAQVTEMKPNMVRNKLFSFLHENKILNKRNEPYHEHVDKGYFRQNGTTHINLKTVVFQKGVDYIGQLVLKKGR